MGFPQISVEAHKLILSAFQNENGSNRLTREGQAKSRDCSVLRGRVTSSVTRFRVTSGPGRLGARRTGQVGHQAAAVGDTGTRSHAARFGVRARGREASASCPLGLEITQGHLLGTQATAPWGQGG